MENKKTRITLMNLLMVIFGIILAIGIVALGCYQTYSKFFGEKIEKKEVKTEVLDSEYNYYEEDTNNDTDFENEVDTYTNDAIENNTVVEE